MKLNLCATACSQAVVPAAAWFALLEYKQRHTPNFRICLSLAGRTHGGEVFEHPNSRVRVSHAGPIDRRGPGDEGHPMPVRTVHDNIVGHAGSALTQGLGHG